ncbi:MAG: tRNA adenosine(34) deaminase [Candidatus Westeberhardia cardiocondylae]|nr:tRNA adenosine(34) deaminase TadA [Candidatus Westeberhardia cardiocondylae]MCR3756506.1 tRNA adenosine(34) deaminase [Candidatus Westeberhardia cardiocondylae]
MNILCSDEFWMYRAIRLAYYAEYEGEVPVGSIITLNNEVIGEGWNCSIKNSDPSSHAEIVSLRQGGKYINNYRLLQTTMYVTLEPCIMCMGAIIHARVERLVFGAENSKKNGVVKILLSLSNILEINHNINITSGVLEKLCSLQLKNFFRQIRCKIKTIFYW